MYVLFLDGIEFPRKYVNPGEIYYVQIAGYHGGYALFALTEDTNSRTPENMIGSLHPKRYSTVDNQEYILSSCRQLLELYWNNKEYLLNTIKQEVMSENCNTSVFENPLSPCIFDLEE